MNVESTSVIHYVNQILIDAITSQASDIHFEPYASTYRIRYRLDGLLHAIDSPPFELMSYIITRIKILANLDISERRLPQDGRFQLAISPEHVVDFRVSICPMLHGEKMVLRVLNSEHHLPSVDQLGMTQNQKIAFLNALSSSQGLILVCGATGSGKTMTLYTALNQMNKLEKNISTVEDPVEVPLEGINQVPIQYKTGLDFATVLRSLLRQDPDVIMVGEIRDLETAEIAVKAAHTGHLVLSSLHTNNVAETILRLMNMGISPLNIASSLSLVISQRLVRKLCVHCKKKEKYDEAILLAAGFSCDVLSDFTGYSAVGCEYCFQGYKGRVGLFEVMPVSFPMSQLILKGGDVVAMKALAKQEGCGDIKEAGLIKVREGITSISEIQNL